MGTAPEHQQAYEDENISAGVEKSIPQRIETEVLNRHSRVHAAEHMMPLQDLMEDYSVEETTQAKTEQDACRGRETPQCFCHGCNAQRCPISFVKN